MKKSELHEAVRPNETAKFELNFRGDMCSISSTHILHINQLIHTTQYACYDTAIPQHNCAVQRNVHSAQQVA